MSILLQIQKPQDRSVIATITGDSGMGKTTLAATFPKPIFIRAEDGLQAIPLEKRPDSFPVLENVVGLWQQLTALINEEHNYETLVIDSVTALERLFIEDVVANDPKKPKSINQALGGYGAGLAAVAAMHQRVRKAAGMLNANKNMHVIFIAHADTETIELPDQDPYTRYSLRLGKRSSATYIDDSDLVGFIKLKTLVLGEGERKKAISDGERVVTCHAVASHVSKNRFSITEDITVKAHINPFLGLLPSLGEPEKPQVKPNQTKNKQAGE